LSARELYVTFLSLELLAENAPDPTIRKRARSLADRIQAANEASPDPSFMVFRGDSDDLDDDDEAEPPR
jgi:hypothetical protein